MVARGRPRPAGRACQSSEARRQAAGSLSCGGEYVRQPLARSPEPGAGLPTLRGGRPGLGAGEGVLPTRAAGRTGARPPVMAAVLPSALVGDPGRDPEPRLLRGPEVNPDGQGAGRALLMAFSGPGPRLGSGFPRPAALSPTSCLASVTRDRALRANSECPRALHVPGTPQASPLGSGHCLPPRSKGHL